MKKCSLFLVLFLQLSTGFAEPCAQPQEMQAIRVRALQTNLMLAGLSCNGQKHYNHFVRSYRSELKTYADAMRGYFRRVYGANGETEMNEFVTKLANESSKSSIKHGAQTFCSDAREWFEAVEQESHLQNVAFTYRGDIRECAY